MLFRGLTPAEAAQRLNDARERLADRRLINRKTDEPFGVVTFSGGVADLFGYSDPRAALKAADEALYRAKESGRSEEHTSELQSLMRISYAVFCLKKKTETNKQLSRTI